MKLFHCRLALAGAASLGLLLALPRQANCALVVVDQQNTATVINGSPSNGVGTGPGQSFTPALGMLNAATFGLAIPGGGVSTLRLDMFAGAGFGGTLLGSSDPVTITNISLQNVEFDFAATQVVVPGSMYTFRVTLTSGTEFGVAISNNSYAGGVFYTSAQNATGVDAIFAEGTRAVPEPSVWALLGVGAAGVGIVALRRWRVA